MENVAGALNCVNLHTLPNLQHREKLKRMVCSFFEFFLSFLVFCDFFCCFNKKYSWDRNEQTRRAAPTSCLPLNNTQGTQATNAPRKRDSVRGHKFPVFVRLSFVCLRTNFARVFAQVCVFCAALRSYAGTYNFILISPSTYWFYTYKYNIFFCIKPI